MVNEKNLPEDKKGKRKKKKQDNRKKVRRNSWKTRCASRRR
ncbi:MAG: hypothetical protein NTX82_05980 [Candidatus Parcubacteria bacterium]|nr:hypothetical protein [Candidatus Parcubacteria bacterium]